MHGPFQHPPVAKRVDRLPPRFNQILTYSPRMKTRPKKIQVKSIVKIKPEYFEQNQQLYKKEEDHVCFTFDSKTGKIERWPRSELQVRQATQRLNATWIVTKIFPSGCHIRCVTDTQLHFKGTIDFKHLICVISCI